MIKTIINSIKTWSNHKFALKESVVNPDWENNDSSDNAYIENRPFYDSRVYGDITETLEYTADSGTQYVVNDTLLNKLISIIDNGGTFDVTTSSGTQTVAKRGNNNYAYYFYDTDENTVLEYANYMAFGFAIIETTYVTYTELMSGSLKQIDDKFINSDDINDRLSELKKSYIHLLDKGSISYGSKINIKYYYKEIIFICDTSTYLTGVELYSSGSTSTVYKDIGTVYKFLKIEQGYGIGTNNRILHITWASDSNFTKQDCIVYVPESIEVILRTDAGSGRGNKIGYWIYGIE